MCMWFNRDAHVGLSCFVNPTEKEVGMSNIKSKFFERYPGPRGAHLSHVTSTTLTGDFDMAKQSSIHPRVQGGRQVHEKANTAK